MGKKTRTRRTKWRRLSLGDASGPEEDDDEPQTCADQQQPESTTPTTPSADEKIVLVSGAEVEEELCDSVVPVGIAATNVVIMPGHQSDETALSQSQPHVHHQQRTSGWKPPAKAQQTGSGYYNANGRQSTATQSALAQPNSVNGQQQSNGYRRANSSGQRYNGSSSGNGGYNGYNSYGRANSWNTNGSYDHHHSHHHSQQPGGLGKTHGIEKKIFNDEEYTKISTPRQEVLFKKGSIGAKKRLPATTTPTTTAETTAPAVNSTADDNGNASSSPTLSPPSSASAAGLNSEADCFQYSGNNDSGSTGDASSTAGEMVGGDAAAALSGYGDGAPLVCIPMYDFYGAYGGMYPGSTMLVQTYPGGPLVAAVPVPMPLYTGANPGGAGSGVGGTAGGSHEMTTAFYYTLGYPAAAAGGGELAASPYDAASHGSRRNSLESYQASSTQEVMTMSETSSSSSSSSASENNSPCSTGPSSQGPASPQGELVSAPIDAKAQAAAAASAMALLDLNSHHHNHHHQRLGNQGKMAVAGFVYPAYPYGLAPPALYASAGCDAAAAAFFYDNPSTEYYYDDDGLLVAVDDGQAAAGMFCDQIGEEDDDNQLMAVAEEDVDVEVPPVFLQPKEEPPVSKPVVAVQPVVSGRRKKKRKRRNKRVGNSQPQRVTDDVAADNDDEDGEEEEEEEVEEPVVCVVSSISLPIEPPLSQSPATCDSSPASLTVEVEEIIVDASPEPSTTPIAAAAEKEEEEASLEVSPTSLLQSETVTSIETNQVSCSSLTASHCSPPSVLDTLLVLSKSSFVDEVLQESSGRLTPVDQPRSTESIDQNPSVALQSDQVSPDFSLSCSSSSSSLPTQVNNDEVQSLPSDTEAVLVNLPEILSAAVDEENEELLSIESDSLASAEQPLLRPESEAMDRDSLDREEDSNNEVIDDDAHDDFVQLHLPDEGFDHEPLLSRQVQLWRTVILEESEPESKEMSIHSSMDGINDDSGIAVCNSSSPLSACTAEQGPISKAVSQWLESAPIQQQLIASTSSLVEDEQDEENISGLSGDEDENDHVPKNGLFDPCTAPSSEQSFTDGPQLRVDSVELATGGDLLQEAAEDEEPLDRPLGPDCSPAKFSKYYQLGVTMEEDGEDEQLIKPEDAIQPCPLETAGVALVGEQATTTDLTNNDPKKKTKRNSKWRRILLARRAVHNNKSDKTKGLRSGQSCCAVQ